MNILPITVIGDKILRNKAKKVESVDNETVILVKNMMDTMHNANGIGLAANQVGSDKSIIVIDLSVVEDYEDLKPIILINPLITFKSKELVYMEEGCLSIPNIRSDVERPEYVEISFQDINMKDQKIEADDYLARVLQHEYDHLQGILFTDLISPEEKRRLKVELNKIRKREVKIDYPLAPKAKK